MNCSHRVLAPLLLGLLACEPEVSAVESGLPPDKQLAQLDPGEEEQLCEATDDYLAATLSSSDAKALACRLDAVFTALADGDKASCEKDYQACLAEPEDEDEGGDESCSIPTSEWDDCTATVSEAEACFTEYVDLTVNFMRSLSCDKIAEYQANEGFGEPELGSACDAALKACPGLLIGEDTPSP